MKKKSWARKTADENLIRASILLLLLFIIAVLLGLYIQWIFGARDTIMLCTGIVFGSCFYYMAEKVLRKGFLPRYGRYKGLVQGEVGEAAVNDALKKNLGKGNLILADVILEENMGNIDHIIIGQYGIFVIETKTHHGRIICEGDTWFQDKKIGEKTYQIKLKYSLSKQAKSNAIRLKSFLKQYYPKLSDEWVKAIVVYPNRQSERDCIEIKNTPQDCEIFDSIDSMMEEIKKEKVLELTSDDLSQLENIFMPRTADTTITN
jgi:hypothetical protein